VRSDLVESGVAGCFAAGEIGPVAGRNFVHGFTASILAFGGSPDPA
jgi:small ligand-binding sensory domain FIST